MVQPQYWGFSTRDGTTQGVGGLPYRDGSTRGQNYPGSGRGAVLRCTLQDTALPGEWGGAQYCVVSTTGEPLPKKWEAGVPGCVHQWAELHREAGLQYRVVSRRVKHFSVCVGGGRSCTRFYLKEAALPRRWGLQLQIVTTRKQKNPGVGCCSTDLCPPEDSTAGSWGGGTCSSSLCP